MMLGIKHKLDYTTNVLLGDVNEEEEIKRQDG